MRTTGRLVTRVSLIWTPLGTFLCFCLLYEKCKIITLHLQHDFSSFHCFHLLNEALKILTESTCSPCRAAQAHKFSRWGKKWPLWHLIAIKHLSFEMSALIIKYSVLRLQIRKKCNICTEFCWYYEKSCICLFSNKTNFFCSFTSHLCCWLNTETKCTRHLPWRYMLLQWRRCSNDICCM